MKYWHLLGLMTAAGVGTLGCIQKSVGPVNENEPEPEGMSLCGRYCAKVDETCGSSPSCESNCTDLASSCDTQATGFIDCALARPMSCSASGTPDTAGCDSEFAALTECLSGSSGSACSAMFDSCAETFCCEDGSTCVESGDPEFGGHVCVPLCETDEDCFTGCCLGLEAGGAACGFWGDCAPVGTGNPCWYDRASNLADVDCGSNSICLDGGCAIRCASDADCDTSFLGYQNICVELNDGFYCLPGCNDSEECELYYLDGLTCLPGDTGSYCY